MAISLQRVIRSTSCLVIGRVFEDSGFNGAIFDLNKFKMAAATILDNFEWPSPQRLTIYLYSAHRAVIFAIAQLSCLLFIIGGPLERSHFSHSKHA